MTCILAERLKEVTFSLRRMEKEHYLKVQEMHGDQSIRDTNANIVEEDGNGEQEMILEEENTHKSAEI